MTRRKLLLVFGAVPVVSAQNPSSDTETPVFRLDVSLVTVDARVTGPDGRDIGGLEATDFIIYDEDQRPSVTHFGRESTPVEVLMVLDVSPEMRPFLLELTPRVSQALEPLRRSDRAGAVLFAGRSEVIQRLTPELIQVPRTVVNNIYKDRFGRTTMLNEALVEASRYLRSEPAKGRRTIIVVTTNQGVRGAIPDQQVVRELLAADAVLNAVLVGDAANGPRTTAAFNDPNRTPPDVYRYAHETGGETATGEQPSRALRRIIEQATTRYSLQYPSPSGEPGTFRSVRVELSPKAQSRYPGAVVKARSGYEVPK